MDKVFKRYFNLQTSIDNNNIIIINSNFKAYKFQSANVVFLI